MEGAKGNQELLRGTCLSMCPAAEMRLRQRSNLVHAMECRPKVMYNNDGSELRSEQFSHNNGSNGNSSNNGKRPALLGDPQFFVKEFARSSAGREIRPADVRPVCILARTVRYLLTQALERRDVAVAQRHHFISDRLRAVRQDLAVQGVPRGASQESQAAVSLLAACVRYYILQQYRMCDSPLADFDPVLNVKQLQEVLAGVVRAYRDWPPLDPAPQSTPEPPPFSFDYDDDEDEFLRPARDVNADSNNVDDVVDGIADMRVNGSSPNCEPSAVLNDEDHIVTDSSTQASNNPSDNISTNKWSNITNKESNKHDANEPKTENPTKPTPQPPPSQQTTPPPPTSHQTTPQPPPSHQTTPQAPPRPQGSPEPAPNSRPLSERAEMEAVYLLLNYDRAEAVAHAVELPAHVREAAVFARCLAAARDHHSCGSYAAMLRLLPQLPPLLQVCLTLSLGKLRRQAMQVLCAGHGAPSGTYSLAELARLLCLSAPAAKEAAEHYGVAVKDAQVLFARTSFRADAPVLPLAPDPRLEAVLAACPLSSLLLPRPLPLH